MVNLNFRYYQLQKESLLSKFMDYYYKTYFNFMGFLYKFND